MTKGFCISVIIRILRQIRIEDGDDEKISVLEESLREVGQRQREIFERYKLSSR